VTSKAARIGVWILSIVLAFVFLMAGVPKLLGQPGHVRGFAHWGYPDWFRITIGVMELTAVVLLLLGRTAAFGAILIIVVMLGAWATHLLFDGGRNMTSEVVPLVLASILLVIRRRQLTDAIARIRR
jgi:putative oxidoreductase